MLKLLPIAEGKYIYYWDLSTIDYVPGQDIKALLTSGVQITISVSDTELYGLWASVIEESLTNTRGADMYIRT